MPTAPRLARSAAVALLCLAAAAPCLAADTADIAEMKRAIEELRAQNRALANRLATLEAEKAAKAEPPARSVATPPEAIAATAPAPAPPGTDDLARRVGELETAKTAQEDATRAIIRESVSSLGSKINESMSLGGSIEVLAGRGKDFDGVKLNTLQLNSAELNFDIQVGDWVSGSLVLEYINGSNTVFATTRGIPAGVDRVNVDTASITIGDVQRFPLFMQAGRIVLPFGSGTGVHRSDTLAIEDPLTIEGFQFRRDAIGIGFGLPTPAPQRPSPPVVVPPVRPLVLAPLFDSLGKLLGYSPPAVRPTAPIPVSLPPDPPPFYGRLFFYEGNNNGYQRGFTRNVSARLGYRDGGHCGRPYSELRATDLCPWSLDFNVDYIGSIFDSSFFEEEYVRFVDQFGPVPGLASTVKLSLGPVLLQAEWNGATRRAVFNDDLGTKYSIKPGSWQASIGYQFDWNPWVETLGGQGTFVAFGYGQTRDFAGVIEVVDGEPVRIGSLPRSRWTLTAGEWVTEGLRVQLEYSRIRDYPVSQGGTGATGSGFQLTLAYVW